MAAGVTIAIMALCAVLLAAVSAAETALERASDVRIATRASQGNAAARRIARGMAQPARFLGPLTTARALFGAGVMSSAAYLGARTMDPLPWAAVYALGGGLVVAAIEVSCGLLAAPAPEDTGLRLSRLVQWTNWLFTPIAYVIGLPGRLLGRRSLAAAELETESDILTLVEREEAAGGVEESERRMIRGVIKLEDTTAREIMVPRINIAAAEINDSVGDVAEIVNARGFSRVPIFRETVDDIAGIVYAKDLLRDVCSGGADRKLSELLRTPMFIPESKRLDELLAEMRAARTHMAIVVDEYGGTAGLVTIEDLLEEIVGEIEDEYDVAAPPMERLSDDEVLLDAGAATDVLRELFGLEEHEIDSEDYDTVGGFVIHQLGCLPSVGDEVVVDGLNIRVLSMTGRRVKRLRVTRTGKETVAPLSSA